MKIELSNDLIKGMYYFQMLKADDNKHKDCRHIFLVSIEDSECEFLCSDCMVSFRALLKESDNPLSYLNEQFRSLIEQTDGYKLWLSKKK